jgi:hypothetical protein
MADAAPTPFPEEERRPYAAAANVKEVLKRVRTRNLPEVIDDEFFRLVDIPDVVFGRVRDALRFLDMIGDDGRPTDRLRAVAAATDEEYQTLFASAIREAYRDDFERVDPAQDTQAQIVNAFRRYLPRSQTSRMVMLFLGLCREAGVPVLDAPRDRAMRSTVGRTPKPPPHQRTRTVRPTAGAGSRAGSPPPPAPSESGSLFGITEKDIALLDEDEFQEVWGALGKVARARARASIKPVPASQEPDKSVGGGQI